jgi:hypothetical protein
MDQNAGQSALHVHSAPGAVKKNRHAGPAGIREGAQPAGHLFSTSALQTRAWSQTLCPHPRCVVPWCTVVRLIFTIPLNGLRRMNILVSGDGVPFRRGVRGHTTREVMRFKD